MGEFEFGAEGRQEVPSFEAHRLRHREDHLVSFRSSDPGEADAGVSAGGFDDGGAFFQDAGLFGVPDHLQGDPVLDGPAGVEGFDLEDEAGFLPFESADLQQGRASDEVRE